MAPSHVAALRGLGGIGSEKWTTNIARHAVVAAAGSGHAMLSRRDLTVTDTQKVTLGIIGAYIVVIALLWNLPYIRWVLWPFKVRCHSCRSHLPPLHMIVHDRPDHANPRRCS
jgi:hypothetical protein